MNEQTRLEIEASAFRSLIKHLQKRTDVQNIDLMNLAGFCRNCLSKWFMAGATEHGLNVNYDQAREIVYGMNYADWQSQYQAKASDEQIQTFQKTKQLHAKISGHD